MKITITEIKNKTKTSGLTAYEDIKEKRIRE